MFQLSPRAAQQPPEIEGGRAYSVMRWRVLRHLEDVGESGATDDEMQCALAMAAVTQRPRRVELVKAGKVKDSGRRRPTRHGRDAIVWVATVRSQRAGASVNGEERHGERA